LQIQGAFFLLDYVIVRLLRRRKKKKNSDLDQPEIDSFWFTGHFVLDLVAKLLCPYKHSKGIS
jgi:hypothetical protein